VHVDKRVGNATYSAALRVLGEALGVFFIERERCYSGDLSLVRATLKALNTALALTPDADYLVSSADRTLQ
jgi:hypothetical protein